MATEAVHSADIFEHIGLRDRVLSLRSLDALAMLDRAALALLAEHTTPRRWAKGALLLGEGTPIEEVHIVTQGLVRVMRRGRHITDVSKGYGVGFLSTLAGDKDGVTAEALEATSTLALPVSVLFDSFEQNFSLLRNAIRLSAFSLLQARGSLPTNRPQMDADPGVVPDRPRTFVEKLILIRQNPLFADANVDAAVEVCRREKDFAGKAGDVLFEIGDHSDHWLRLEYGRIRCENASGVATTVGGGFVLGVMEAFAAVPRQFRAVAETDYVGSRTELETTLGVVEAHFRLGIKIIRDISESLLEANSDSRGEDEGDDAPIGVEGPTVRPVGDDRVESAGD